MRLTTPVSFPMKVRWMKDYSWHRWRKVRIYKSPTEAALAKQGISMEDANEFLKRDSPLFVDMDAIPKAQPIFPEPLKMDTSHPDWHPTPYMIFDWESFCVEGVPQAQIFTKSVTVKNGLPENILNIARSTHIEHQDLLVQRIIKQAFMWDFYLDKLPKLRDLEIPQFKFPRKYGIPMKRSNEILLRNLLRLCDTEFPSIAMTRAVANEQEVRVTLNRHESLVQMKLTPMLTILSKELLKTDVVNPEKVADINIPSISPFLSNVGLEDHNIYKEGDHIPFKSDSPYPYIQTALFSHHIPGSHTHVHPRWNDARFSGTTVMYNFGIALSMARRKYGDDVKGILPEPITTQVIHLTGRELQFSVFQLNTVDLEESSNSPVKNIYWLTPKIKLFNNCGFVEGCETFDGYNPVPFKVFLGMYLNGSM